MTRTMAAGATGHKFLQADALDYLLLTRAPKAMPIATPSACARPCCNARAIIDPVWGGIFQYSDDGTWNSPHYEKIMSSQANAVRLYATAYALLGEAEFRAAAEQVAGYMLTHLKAPEGGFYPSQDADLSAEMKGKAVLRPERRGAPQAGRAAHRPQSLCARGGLGDLRAGVAA